VTSGEGSGMGSFYVARSDVRFRRLDPPLQTEADMVRGQWLMAGWLAVAGLAPGLAAAGDRAEKLGIVVHLVELARVADRELTVAKTEVERVFQVAGVEVTWADAPLPVPSSIDQQRGNGRPHVALFIVDAHEPSGAGAEIAGEAYRSIGRAFVFRNRIVDAAKLHEMDEALVLGHALAHELGHLLLPPSSHSRHGIMRPSINFEPVGFHSFEPEQASRIRAVLTDGTVR
jgi:hypothetical protein